MELGSVFFMCTNLKSTKIKTIEIACFYVKIAFFYIIQI